MWLQLPAVKIFLPGTVPEIYIWHCLQKQLIGPWLLLARRGLLVMGKHIENDWVTTVFFLSYRPASRISLWSQSSWRNHCSKPSMPKNVNGALCETCTYANRWSACSCVTGLPMSQRRQFIAISVIHSTCLLLPRSSWYMCCTLVTRKSLGCLQSQTATARLNSTRVAASSTSSRHHQSIAQCQCDYEYKDWIFK